MGSERVKEGPVAVLVQQHKLENPAKCSQADGALVDCPQGNSTFVPLHSLNDASTFGASKLRGENVQMKRPRT